MKRGAGFALAQRRLMLARSLAAVAAAGGLVDSLRAQTTAGAPPGPDVADAVRESVAPPLPAAGALLGLPAAELLDGQRFSPAQAEGRVLLAYWWASWCPFCAVVSPMIDKLWQAERGRGLLLLTFSIDRRPEDARAYLQRRGYAWPTAWMSPVLQKALPKPRGLPVTVVRGRDGRVLQAEAGQLFPEDVEALARHV